MFRTARLKLTAWYLLIIMCISLSFSMVIYRVLSNEIDRLSKLARIRIERRLRAGGLLTPNAFIPNNPPVFGMDPELLDDTRHRLLLTLIAVNGGIFIIAGGVGYFLAGRTLLPIKEMLDEQNQFISDSSHELRTPLTSLKSALEVNLRDKHLTLKGAKTLITESIEEVNKLQSLSDELLTLAQFQKPNGSVVFEKFLLSRIIESAIHKVEVLAKQKNISIQNDTQELFIEGSVHGITDLIVIMLDNAIKYSGRDTTIVIDDGKKDGSAIISIKDHGIGIDEKDIPHIFDRFYRADITRSKTKSGGYGLGLSIAKKIVDLHHGSINVESALGKGTTFWVSLPFKQTTHITKPSLFS